MNLATAHYTAYSPNSSLLNSHYSDSHFAERRAMLASSLQGYHHYERGVSFKRCRSSANGSETSLGAPR